LPHNRVQKQLGWGEFGSKKQDFNGEKQTFSRKSHFLSLLSRGGIAILLI
jgi:hypothetical protein